MAPKRLVGCSALLVAAVVYAAVCGGCAPKEPESTPEEALQPAPAVEEPAGTPPAPEPSEERPGVDGDWLVARLSAEMSHLNPLTSTDYYARQVIGWVFEPLIKYDNETLEPIPHIAESWEISDDHLVYTFHLRKDVRFSDGTPLTARDVKFTYDKTMDPATDCAHLRHMYQDVERLEIPDDYTVRYVCKQPYFRHLIVLGLIRIIPAHIYGQGDFNDHPNNRHPIGSGPYVFQSWETNQEVVLTRNENYWNVKPHILKRVYKIVSDDNAAFQMLEAGDIDSMEDVPREAWVTRMAKPSFEKRFNKFMFYSPRYTYLAWNKKSAWFGDKRVRQAMTMLLDRELIHETIYHNTVKTITGPQFIESPEYASYVEPWPFDPGAAKNLLEAAGWTDSDGDGVRDKDGTPFQFEMMYGTGRPATEQLMTVYQEELDHAGIKMILKPLEFATLLESTSKGNFDAFSMGWVLPLYPDPYSTWHSSQTKEGGYNRVWFENAEADKLIEDARVEFDRQKRIKLYHRLHEILHDEQPYTFLNCPAELVAVDKRFHGIKLYPYGLDSEEWWVPKDQQKYK
ncbi:MAG: hypothetical protein GWP08_02585 [Nitrospiraceae bacterium]|nr:hypothetical protein [Nitrospiraceae bacterium]